MSAKRSPTHLPFRRAASQRLEEAEFLLSGNYTTGAIYLAGYAIECMLKALILFSEPARRNAQTLRTFRGTKGHAFEWLHERLSERGIQIPLPLVREFAEVNYWTTELRYDPRVRKRQEADRFMGAAKRIIVWIKGRL